MTKRFLLLSALSIALVAPVAEAQRSSRRSGPVELGIDGGITFGLDAPHFTLVSLPTQAFRVGYFLNDRFELEPRVSISSASGGGNSVTAYSLEAGLLWQPDGDRVGKGLYFRPFVGLVGVSVSGGGGGDNSSGVVGIGAGLKLPFADRRMATRLEANYSHSDGTNLLGLLFGLSWFTR